MALEKKTDDLLTDVESLKELRRKNEAEDFYKFARLDASANFFKDWIFVVNVLIEVLKEIDFDLISPELKDLIQIELGMDIVKLKKELNVEEQNSALSILRKDFMKFFTLDDAAYTEFMKYQTARIEAGNLKVCALRTSSI